MSIIFVKPRFHYSSFTDFWALVEFSGFEWCYVDQINLRSANIYILSLVDFTRDKWNLSWWQKKWKRARLILWDLERPTPRGGTKADRRLLSRQGFDEVWNSDVQLAKDLGTRFVILGSDERLGQKPSWIKWYNFAPMCYINDRREPILDRLKRVAPNGWGRERQKILSVSRFGLSIHQDSDLYMEPLRLALFAAYRLPVISEAVYDTFPLKGYLLTSPYDKLVEFCQECLLRYKELKELGKEINQKLCFDYRFKNMVKYACKN